MNHLLQLHTHTTFREVGSVSEINNSLEHQMGFGVLMLENSYAIECLNILQNKQYEQTKN